MATPSTRALDKALSLLSLLVADGGRRSIAVLAAEVGLPRATAHRLVSTLVQSGFLISFARGRYLPGPALLQLSSAATMTSILQSVGRRVLDELARQTRMVAHLGVFEGDMVTYLLKSGRAGETLFTREGMQLEAYCSAIGKLLLALLPDEPRERYLNNGPFIALTPHTITDANALRQALAAIRVQDYARDECEVDSALRCIATPIRNPQGQAIAALSLSARQTRGEKDPGQHLAALRAAALALEQRLYPAHKTAQA